MDKLLIRQDWANHFVWGALFTTAVRAGVIFLGLFFPYFAQPEVQRVGPTIVGVALAAGKELIHDKYLKKGDPTWVDFWWTVGGVFVTDAF